MAIDPKALERLSRDALIAKARQLGATRAELLTRPELRDEIIRLTESDELARRRARGWFGVARDLVASVVSQGLNLQDTAELIRAVNIKGPNAGPPVATVTLAEIYAAQGHVSKALKLLDEVLAKEPDHQAANAARQRLTPVVGTVAPQMPPEPEDFAASADGVESSDSFEPQVHEDALSAVSDKVDETHVAEVVAAVRECFVAVEEAEVAPVTVRAEAPYASVEQPTHKDTDCDSYVVVPNETALGEPAPTELLPDQSGDSASLSPNVESVAPTHSSSDECVDSATTDSPSLVIEPDQPSAGQVLVGEYHAAEADVLPAAVPSSSITSANPPSEAERPDPVRYADDLLVIVRRDGREPECVWQLGIRSKTLRAETPSQSWMLKVLEVRAGWQGPETREEVREITSDEGRIPLPSATGHLRASLGRFKGGKFIPLSIAVEFRWHDEGAKLELLRDHSVGISRQNWLLEAENRLHPILANT